MRELEDILSEAPLATPSPRLRARLEAAFARADERGGRWFRFPIPLWAGALAMLACGALGFWAHAALTPPAPQVVYILPAEGELGRMLTGEAERRPEEDPRNWRVTVTAISKKKL